MIFGSYLTYLSRNDYIFMFSGQNNYGSSDVEDLLLTSTVVSNNINRLTNYYRSLMWPILIQQAEPGVLIIGPNLGLWQSYPQSKSFLAPQILPSRDESEIRGNSD